LSRWSDQRPLDEDFRERKLGAGPALRVIYVSTAALRFQLPHVQRDDYVVGSVKLGRPKTDAKQLCPAPISCGDVPTAAAIPVDGASIPHMQPLQQTLLTLDQKAPCQLWNSRSPERSHQGPASAVVHLLCESTSLRLGSGLRVLPSQDSPRAQLGEFPETPS
jgi:hypothetical protein